MHVMHIALGGCLAPPPVRYGLTRDTGGHIAYVLGAAQAESDLPDIDHVTILTRAFDAPALGPDYALERQPIGPGLSIRRIATARRDYLDKEALDAEIPALTDAFLEALSDPADRPDVIHAHFSDAAVLARAAERRFGIPWLYTAHSLALEGPGHPASSPRVARERAAIESALAIIASSRDEAERQLPRYAPDAEGRVHTVEPGLTIAPTATPDAADRLIAPFLRDPSKPILLAVARPIPKKNLVALVEAYAASPELQERANLVLLAGLREGIEGGDAEQTQVIRALFDAVDRHDLWGRVAVPRHHTPDDVASLYARAARGGVFCNPALHEPFGLTLVEAACYGVPLVATRNGGPVDIVDRIGAGRLVDPTDRAAIAAALLAELSNDLSPKRAAIAAKRAREIFDWSTWARRVNAIQHELLARPRPGPAPARTLLASDIDATLTGDGHAAHRFADWVDTRDPQIRFAVATGRSVSQARAVLTRWALPTPDLFITSCGTEIWRRTGHALTLCTAYAATLDWDRAGIAAALGGLGLTPQARCEQRRWKLSYLGTADDGLRIGDALDRHGLSARVIPSHGRFIDVMPMRAGKAAAIRFEARRLGLSDRAVIVAGDSGNDADMLAAFDNAILPANAMDEIAHLTGGYRSPYAHADGVLDGLGRLGLAPRHAPPREDVHA